MTEPVEFRCPVYPRRMFGRLHAHGQEGQPLTLREPLFLPGGRVVTGTEMVFACDDCRKAARPAPVRVLHHFDLTGQHLRSEQQLVVPRRP